MSNVGVRYFSAQALQELSLGIHLLQSCSFSEGVPHPGSSESMKRSRQIHAPPFAPTCQVSTVAATSGFFFSALGIRRIFG